MLPSTLRVIGKRMFADCENLKSVVFGDDSQLEEIQSEAFRGSGIESFTAPASLRNIDSTAFQDCKKLKHVDISACTL